ncbi:MAG: cytochrome b5 domain-containing protein [Deltaproteobacteria bacterium]
MNNKRTIGCMIFLLLVALTFNLAGCSKASNKALQKPGQTQSTAPNIKSTPGTQNTAVKTFTRAELSQYNGQNGKPAYVAVNGKVYNVTGSKAWRNGQHRSYKAGRDLTADMKNAPHGMSVLRGLPVVGGLVY